MPTITNSGTVNYTIGTTTGAVTSNTVSTDLEVTYSATMLKTVNETTFTPGQTLTYQIRINNTGTGTLYSLVVVDDLGTETYGTPLSYVNGSVSAYLYNASGTTATPLSVAVTTTSTSVTFTISGTIPQGYFVVLTYDALVDSDLSTSFLSILNQATFTAAEGGIGGATLSVQESDGINRQTLTVVKSASTSTATPGQSLTYTFTLTNIGSTVATIDTLTDQLPANFQVNSPITAVIGTTSPVTVDYVENTDYTVSDTNLLTLDPASGSTALTVPALSGTTPGVTTVTINGTIIA